MCLYGCRACPAPSPPSDPCMTNPTPTYASHCGQLKNVSGPFASCISQLDSTVSGTSTLLYNDCILDACMSNGLELCDSVRSLVDECANMGFQIDCDAWQTSTNCCKYHSAVSIRMGYRESNFTFY